MSKVPVLELEGQLPRPNASYEEAMGCLKQKSTTFSPLQINEFSPYHPKVIQGANIIPRCFWLVKPPSIARVTDQERPQLETDPAVDKQAKVPWKGIIIKGALEAKFLFATLLSDYLLPFGHSNLSLAVVPVTEDNHGRAQILTDSDAVQGGYSGLANWLRKAEKLRSEKGKNSKTVKSIYDGLDYLQKLTVQRPKSIKVLYNKSGTHVCACVIDARDVRNWEIYGLNVQGFIADQVTYWYEAESLDEAHYLCAVLNAPVVDVAIKPWQTKGGFSAHKGKGERDIHRRPFEVVRVPTFSKHNERHRLLARLSIICHEKIVSELGRLRASGELKLTKRLRGALRSTILKEQLAVIDRLAGEALEGCLPDN